MVSTVLQFFIIIRRTWRSNDGVLLVFPFVF